MYLTNLYPAPRSVTEDENVRFFFGSTAALRISGDFTECEADNLRYLWNRFSFTASDPELIPASGNACEYSLSVGKAPQNAGLKSGDSYAIYADGEGVLLLAKDKKSFFCGFNTLVQLICPLDLTEGQEKLYIFGAEIHDAPALDFRAIHFCVFPDSDLGTVRKAIAAAGFLGMTHAVLEFWGCLQYECDRDLAWADKSFSKAEIKPLVDTAHAFGMEVIPMLNHLGHASASRACIGRHTVLDKSPRKALLFEPDGWTWCTTNSDAYKLLAEMRAELCDLCGDGGYFHLGFDEAYSFGTCPSCKRIPTSELFLDFANRLAEDVSRTGRRPIMWHDGLIKKGTVTHPSGLHVVESTVSRGTGGALAGLDKRMIIADWQYSYTTDENPTTEYFMKAGFDTVVCPFDDIRNIRGTSQSAARLGAYGVMLTTWHHVNNFLRDALLAGNLVWSGGSVNTYFRTENAAILRALCDSRGSFAASGWRDCESRFDE